MGWMTLNEAAHAAVGSAPAEDITPTSGRVGRCRHRGRTSSMWIVLASIIVASFAITAWLYWIGQGGRRQVPADEVVPPGDGSPDDGWKAGLIYFNPADPALLVENRMGWGWTLNFGHRGAWLILIAILAVAIGPTVVRRMF